MGLLFAVALAGVALAAAGQVWSTTVQREREASLIAIGGEFRRALQSYYDASPSVKTPPARLEDLLEDKRFPTVRRHLRKLYRDPITGSADWGLVKAGDRIVGVHSLSDLVAVRSIENGSENGADTKKLTYRDWVFRIGVDALPVETGPAPGPGRPGGGLGTAIGSPPVTSGGNTSQPPANAAVAERGLQPPAEEQAARRRACSERYSGERQQCHAIISGDRIAFARCHASAASRLTACLDGGEGPPLLLP